MPECHEQVDIVEVAVATKTMSQIVTWIDGCSELAAGGTEEAEVALRVLRGWALSAEQTDRDFHWQIISDRM